MVRTYETTINGTLRRWELRLRPLPNPSRPSLSWEAKITPAEGHRAFVVSATWPAGSEDEARERAESYLRARADNGVAREVTT